MTSAPWLRMAAAIDAVNRKVGAGVSWLILAMTLVSAANPVFRRFYQSWLAFRHAQYQWHRIAEASFSNFMAGQRLPFK